MKPSHLFLAVCISLGIAFLSGLGVWQLKRLEWKQALIERAQQGIKSAPVSLAEIERLRKDGTDFEYRPTQATGRFLHRHEAHYFATFKGRPGYFVYTPLELGDGSLLFVNRGYVPMQSKDATTRPAGQAEGTVTIKGLARSAPVKKPNTFVPENDLEKNIFYWKSMDEMVAFSLKGNQAPKWRFFLDADSTVNPGNLPVGGVTRISFPNNHLQYAVTWFGLALALLGVGGVFLVRTMRLSRRADAAG